MKGINGGEKNILKIKKEDKKITTIKEYTINKEKREKEVIPGTFDPVFKAVLTSNKEYLAEIINYVTGLPKEDVIKKGIIINSEYVRENIKEKDKKSDLIISIENNIINLEMDRRYYEGSNRKNNKYIHKMVNHYEEKNIVQICFTSYKKEEELEYAKELGYTSGINKGIEKTAKNMLNKNMDISIRSEITGLSKEEIQKLKENI